MPTQKSDLPSEEYEYRIIVPRYTNDGRAINFDDIKDYIMETIKHFGGVTIIPEVIGCWYSEEKKDYVCDVSMIMIAARDREYAEGNWEEVVKKDREFVENLAKRIADDLGQEAVFVEEDTVDVKFVEGEDKPAKFKKRVWSTTDIAWTKLRVP